MITIYKSTDHGLEKIDAIVNGCWISVIDPNTEEIEDIQELGIHQDFVTYPLDLDERPRTEKEDDGTQLILLRIPFFQGITTDVPYITIPLGIIFADNYLITICRHQNDLLQEFSSGKMRGLSTAKRNRFLLRLLLSTANKFLAYLREINRVVETTEDRLQLSMRNKDVMELLKFQKSLVYFTTALRSNQLMLERLQRSQMFKLYPDDEDLLDDVIIENQQAIEMTNISSNILSALMDAFASIISNNLNVVMKFLASVTIVISLPTILTSFFGMNVPFPFFEGVNGAYVIILVVSLVLAGIVAAIFVRRDWF
jgi:magnesium transporter